MNDINIVIMVCWAVAGVLLVPLGRSNHYGRFIAWFMKHLTGREWEYIEDSGHAFMVECKQDP